MRRERHHSAGAAEGLERLAPYLAPPPVLAIISGPSGVGKDSVIACMRRRHAPFHFVVTTTDRPPRADEVEGVHYRFVSTARFQEMVTAGDLLEYAEVYGQWKGVPREEVRRALASGRDAVMRLDVQGAATVRRIVPGAVGIFIAPPSVESLRQRLQHRGSDSPEETERRLDAALAELACCEDFDYVVVNHDHRLDEAAERVAAIIAAERCRTGRRPVTL